MCRCTMPDMSDIFLFPDNVATEIPCYHTLKIKILNKTRFLFFVKVYVWPYSIYHPPFTLLWLQFSLFFHKYIFQTHLKFRFNNYKISINFIFKHIDALFTFWSWARPTTLLLLCYLVDQSMQLCNWVIGDCKDKKHYQSEYS